MRTEQHDAVVYVSDSEKDYQKALLDHFRAAPLPDDEILSNLGMFLTSKNLARLLFFYEIYKKVVTTHGVIMEFGSRWGQTTALLATLRGIFEPFNRHRKIIGFDTFSGFTELTPEDGEPSCTPGSYSVTKGYEEYLDKLLAFHEQLNPIPHIKKYELVKGDAVETIPEYLSKHPETMVSLAVFDFDLYKPTKVALEAILPRLFKGSILVFDELCDGLFPGETTALIETMGLNRCRVQRLPMTSRLSYFEFEG
jgi:hypothetical protein